MTTLNHQNYQEFIKEMIEKKPRKGRGEMQRMAQYLSIHSTLVSQIMSGSRDLTVEQAHDLSQYLELTESETEYFQLLVQISRASTMNYKKHLQLKLQAFKEEAQKVSKRFSKSDELQEHEKSVFYSSWIYSAIRLYCSTSEEGRTLEDIVSYFQISRTKALEYLQFLTQCRLCESKKDKFFMGQQRTYIDRGSIFFLKHHLNWRLKSIQRSEIAKPEEKLYTVTMSISEEDFAKINLEVTKLLNDIMKISKNTKAEKLVCFNCDLFYIEN